MMESWDVTSLAISATQEKKTPRGILCVFRLLAIYTQLNISFQIHYVA